MALCDPRILKCPELGIVIEFDVGKVWSKVVAFKPTAVYVKKIRTAELDLCAADFHYPHGLAQAVQRFLHPVNGDQIVTPEAKHILEIIMNTYAINTSTNKVIGRFASAEEAAVVAGENPAVKVVSSAEEIAEQLTIPQIAAVVQDITGTATTKYHTKQKAAEALEAALGQVKVTAEPASKKSRRFALAGDPGARKGGFGEICAALSSAPNSTAEEVIALVPSVEAAKVRTALGWGVKHGVFVLVGE